MFADRMVEAVAEHGPLCVGIDPHAGRVPALFGGDTGQGLTRWGEAIIEIAVGRVAAIKPQVGLFERLGPEGMLALQRLCGTAREAGLIVLADAKRADIGSTAAGYAAAYLSAGAPFEADAVTVNPYMGLDTLEPFMAEAEAHNKGVIVLARTSNPGAADFQARDMGGAPLYARVVEALGPLMKRLEGTSGWSGLMLVTGATGAQGTGPESTVSRPRLWCPGGRGGRCDGRIRERTGRLGERVALGHLPQSCRDGNRFVRLARRNYQCHRCRSSRFEIGLDQSKPSDP